MQFNSNIWKRCKNGWVKKAVEIERYRQMCIVITALNNRPPRLLTAELLTSVTSTQLAG